MAVSAAAIAKAAAMVLSNEKTRKAVGWTIAAILSPLILVIVVIVALLSGTTQHNNAAVDLVFNGGAFPSTMAVEYAAQVQTMQGCLATLDYAIAGVNAEMESGTLDGAMVKSVFYSLKFGDPALSLSASEARAFADCFVRYETRTRTVESGTDPDTGETLYAEEEYTVAVAVSQYEAYSNLSAAGYPVTSALSDNAHAVYIRIAYGNGGSYTGAIEYGGERMTELDISQFTDASTKNAADLVTYAIHAWESGWGYVWGTFGDVLTESYLQSKIAQYPDGVGDKESIIREKWLGGRTTDCVGLIKGYGWLDPATLTIGYGTNGMPDVGADQMYNNATVKGSMDTMPDTPGLAVWHSGHIGVYIGNGEVIEAMGTSYGVVKTQLSERSWTAWLEVPYINYN
ncbi:MAG: hypothetical protein PHU76_01595 [Synergistaceae bacterium]|nr:hypothetical protein [Proteiniphilum sp.]MDD3963133.1 hypothetical protein [Synergistaceae bacterium]